jgi:hypothetical protein
MFLSSFLLGYLFFFCLFGYGERSLETADCEQQKCINHNIVHSNNVESCSISAARFVDGIYSLCKSSDEVSAPTS